MTQATALLEQHAQTPRLLSTDKAEIIRRVRQKHPDWQTSLPTQSLVAQTAIEYAKEVGQRPTCGTDRARRLRELVQTAVLDNQSDIQTVQSEEPTPPVQVSRPQTVPQQTDQTARPVHAWPVMILTLPAFVAIWSGWVGLGKLTGFGPVHLLPGTPWADWQIDSAITLPIGMEAYAAYALYIWLTGRAPDNARRFARWSAIGSLALGMAAQVAYHLMTASGITTAPWQITTVVSCLPVVVLGLGAALAHLIRAHTPTPQGGM